MIQLFVKITKHNGLRDTKRQSFNSEIDCMNTIGDWMNNPNYHNVGYHVGECKDGKNKYYLNLKSIA